jgi:hypothetical protein
MFEGRRRVGCAGVRPLLAAVLSTLAMGRISLGGRRDGHIVALHNREVRVEECGTELDLYEVWAVPAILPLATLHAVADRRRSSSAPRTPRTGGERTH